MLCSLGLVAIVALPGSVRTVKLSEGSGQVAYAAGLGIGRLVDLRVSRPPARAVSRCRPAARNLGSARVAYAALVRDHALIRKEPNAHSAIVSRAGRLNQNGFREVLGVIGTFSGARCTADWYRVEVPVLPNGTRGWVRAWAVQTYRVRSRIIVDISQRRLRLFRSGKLIFETAVAVGAPATPTPLGRFFVNERYVLPDSSGPFGPAALGISAHSDALQNVWVEDGPIGIHGTNEPWSIGHAASHGCIRVSNLVMRRLFLVAPAGTPVLVHA